MKTTDEKRQFIELRARGFSYDKIAADLKISKPTLLQWNEELAKEIANLSFLEYETLLSQYQLAKRQRIDAFAAMLERAIEELRLRSLEDLNIKDLLNVISILEGKIRDEIRPIHYFTGKFQHPNDQIELLFKEKTLPLVY